MYIHIFMCVCMCVYPCRYLPNYRASSTSTVGRAEEGEKPPIVGIAIVEVKDSAVDLPVGAKKEMAASREIQRAWVIRHGRHSLDSLAQKKELVRHRKGRPARIQRACEIRRAS